VLVQPTRVKAASSDMASFIIICLCCDLHNSQHYTPICGILHFTKFRNGLIIGKH